MKRGDNRGGMCSRAISFAFSSLFVFLHFFFQLTRAHFMIHPTMTLVIVVSDHTTLLAFLPLFQLSYRYHIFFFVAFPLSRLYT